MAEQIAALRPAKPSKIYIAVDGHRIDNPSDEILCRQVRDCVGLIDWPCKIAKLLGIGILGVKTMSAKR
jgi:hypothetical protein